MTPMRDSDLEHFERHGYVCARGVVSTSLVGEMAAFLAAHADDAVAELRRLLACDDDAVLVGEIDRRLAASSTTGDSFADRQLMAGHYPLSTRLDPMLQQVAAEPGVRAALARLLPGPGWRMHMPPTARFVLPGNRRAGVPPHQDISYNQQVAEFVVMWLPLVPIDAACGGVMVYDGSGRADAVPTGQAADDFWLDGVPTAGYKPVTFEMGLGDVLFLNKRIIHGSAPNLSTHTRYSVDYRFFPNALASTKHYLDLDTMTVVAPP